MPDSQSRIRRQRIALIGAYGQLGTDLHTLLGDVAVPLGHGDIEITDADSVARSLDSVHPDLVINTAAYNLVDRAEDEPETAYAVNALGPRNLALACEQRGIPLVHISTDYVFGFEAERSNPFRETDTPGPISAYGTSKLAGEYFVRSLCSRHFVVRTCGLYGHRGARGKGNFAETMLRLATIRNRLTIIDDQHCTPTSTADLARAIVKLIATDDYGLYHATNAGGTTWYEFACEIFRLMGSPVSVVPISSQEFHAKAKRPSWSVLDSRKLATVIGEEMRPWKEALADYLNERETRNREAERS